MFANAMEVLDLPQEYWLVSVVVLVLTVLVSWTRCFSKQTDNVPWPKVPGALPIVGNSLGGSGIDNFATKIEEWADLYGGERGIYQCNIFGKRYIILCSNESLSTVANERPYNMRRVDQLVAAINSVGGYGLFSAEGETWKADRRLVAPALNKKNIQDYLPFIKQVTRRLVEKWTSQSCSDDGIVVINKDLCKYAIDNIAFIAFAKDFDSLRKENSGEANDILTLFKAVQFRTLAPFRFWNIPIIGQYLDGMAPVRRRVNDMFVGLVHEFQETSMQNDSNEKDARAQKSFLAKVVSLNNQENASMSQKRMIGNLNTMFAAGSESTHVTICSCLWQIATDTTGLQDELAQEARNITNFDDASMDELLEALPKLRSLVYEVIRLKGPAALLGVQNENEFVLDGVSLPPGSKLIMALRYISTLEGSGVRLGPKGEVPSDFCARRWLNTSSSGGHLVVDKPSASMGGCMAFSTGFGTGLRLCPGKDLAEIEILICLASLLRSFDISLKDNHEPMRLVTRFTQSPDIDIELKLKPRTA